MLAGGRKRGRQEDRSCVAAVGRIVPTPTPSSFVGRVSPIVVSLFRNDNGKVKVGVSKGWRQMLM